MLILNNIDKYYNQATVNEKCILKDFDINVGTGDFLCIIGSNGSGKTTLLNIICGNTQIDKGSIKFDKVEISLHKTHKRYENIGRVFQNPALGTCPSMTVIENLSMAENKGKKWTLSKAATDQSRIKYSNMLKDLGLGLENKLDEVVENLSGGQRQAISLIMATLSPIKLLILDEHTAALDPKTAKIIMELTDKMIRQKKLTAIMVTHNILHALDYGNRIIMMHEGNIVLDKSGEEKNKLELDTILAKFNEISLEFGN